MTSSVDSEETSLEEDMEVVVPSDSAKEPVMGDNADEDDHQVAGNDISDKLPPPGKVWKGGAPHVWYWGNSCTRQMPPRTCCKV